MFNEYEIPRDRTDYLLGRLCDFLLGVCAAFVVACIYQVVKAWP